jgi:hypothetical protein
VSPVPEDVAYYRTCADEYLYTLAPVFGEIRAIRESLGTYRVHPRSIYSAKSFVDKLRLDTHKGKQYLHFTVELRPIKSPIFRDGSYDGIQKVLDSINLTIGRGDHLAIKSGSKLGKSQDRPLLRGTREKRIVGSPSPCDAGLIGSIVIGTMVYAGADRAHSGASRTAN